MRFSKILVLTCSDLSNQEKYWFLWFSNSNFAILSILSRRIICSCSNYLEHILVVAIGGQFVPVFAKGGFSHAPCSNYRSILSSGSYYMEDFDYRSILVDSGIIVQCSSRNGLFVYKISELNMIHELSLIPFVAIYALLGGPALT